MKYKIGDKVKIRSWSDMEQEYALNKYGDINVPCLYFTKAKEKWCNKVVTIEKVYLDYYIIKEDNWVWSDDMIDHSATRIISIIYRLKMLRKLDPVLKVFIDRDIKILKSDKPIFNVDTVCYYNSIFRKIKGLK